MEEILLYFALKYEGDFDKIFEALQEKEVVNMQLRDELFSNFNCNYTTIISDDYPKKLKDINCPPFVLFYHGDLEMANDLTIGVLGTCSPSKSGTIVAREIIKELDNNNITIVTGLAHGIDEIANENCKRRIAVLGCGIDRCYPRSNKRQFDDMRENGLIVSEYPNDVEPKRKNSVRRERIISGLSEKLLVCEMSKNSRKTMVVGLGLEQGKDIYCIPSSYDNEKNGANYLISHGANILTSVEDIL